jgi:hypothetical protein
MSTSAPHTAQRLFSVHHLPIHGIKTSHTVRQVDLNLNLKLQSSLRNDGLLYPILVVKENDGYELVDGLHRLTAAIALEWPTIPCHVVESMELPYLMSVANNLRKSLKPSEMVRLILPIYQQEKKTAEQRRRAGGKIPAQGRAAEIAATVFCWNPKELIARIKIVQKADENPEVYGRFLRQMDKRGRWFHQNECLLATEKEISMQPSRLKADKEGLGTIHHGDMLKTLPTFPFKVEAAIFDPPYGVGKIYDTDDGKEWHEPSTPESYWRWFKPRLHAVLDVMHSGGLLICFQAYEYMIEQGYLSKWFGHLQTPTLYHVCKSVDMRKRQYLAHGVDVAVVAWKPGAARMFPPILKGVNRLNWMVSHEKPSVMARNHFACKSQDVMERLLAFTSPGAIVLDPFCGTGSTLWAAEKMGRRWVGVEQSKRYTDLAWKVRKELKDDGYYKAG